MTASRSSNGKRKTEEFDPAANRKFLARVLKLVYLAFTLLILWPVFRFMSFFSNGNKKIVLRGFKKSSAPLLKNGVIISVVDDKILVFSDRCPHLGCTLRYVPGVKEFQCPCHGSKFNLKGERIAGPARLPLTRLVYKKDKNGNLVILLPLSLEK